MPREKERETDRQRKEGEGGGKRMGGAHVLFHISDSHGGAAVRRKELSAGSVWGW